MIDSSVWCCPLGPSCRLQRRWALMYDPPVMIQEALSMDDEVLVWQDSERLLGTDLVALTWCSACAWMRPGGLSQAGPADSSTASGLQGHRKAGPYLKLPMGVQRKWNYIWFGSKLCTRMNYESYSTSPGLLSIITHGNNLSILSLPMQHL